MISEMRIQNIRSLRDTGDVPVKKINIAVGMNSSGKSTFIRVFPLLRQSVEVRTKGPLLWYGRLVDFGDFKEAKTAGSNDEPVAISFDLRLKRQSPRVGSLPGSNSRGYSLPAKVKMTVNIDQAGRDDFGFISKLRLELDSDVVEVTMDPSWVKAITVNGVSFSPDSDQYWYVGGGESKIPNITYLVEKSSAEGDTLEDDPAWAINSMAQMLSSIAHGNTSMDRLRSVAARLAYAPGDKFKAQFTKLSGAPDGVRYALHAYAYAGRTTFLDKLQGLALINVLPLILRDVSASFEEFGAGVRYIEPVRASVERYYRQQDLAVDEIDSSGANTAMYLRSLDAYELRALTAWMEDKLGFRVYTERSSGNVAVKVRVNGESVGRNVADLGFGYSQVLPVILQLWHSCLRPRRASKRASVVAIEQPELHLHPKFQSSLADVFASVSNSMPVREDSVPFFIETHSEHIINRLGALVAEGRLDREDVQVLLFDKEGSDTRITSVQFDEFGVLSEAWPLGFFLPEV
ncbi:TPA: AAA family ATPase [Stenotrophomonas maltophilia]|mgnify:FL=1|uniref:AAA family ATPase n=1 Tax=Stenotrophomonas maltophilia TaxID=40324 RepID=UPI002E76DF4F|nr:AAA family ATPase [Stenotrophomonas maltophilia]